MIPCECRGGRRSDRAGGRGLARTERDPAPPLDTSLLSAAAEHGCLLSFGRAEPLQGFDDLLGALHILSTSRLRVPHIVLAVVTDGSAPTASPRHLAHLINAGYLDVTRRATFSPGIRSLLGHPALTGVVVPSLPSQARPMGDQQPSVRVTRRSRHTNRQRPGRREGSKRQPGPRLESVAGGGAGERGRLLLGYGPHDHPAVP